MGSISSVYHSNKYTAESACEHCAGIIRHERWCITENKHVFYAYDILINVEHMTEGDRLVLHACGILWMPLGCQKTCPKK